MDENIPFEWKRRKSRRIFFLLYIVVEVMFILCMYTVNTEKIASYPFHVDATPKKPYDAFSTITITTENNNGEHLNIVEIF